MIDMLGAMFIGALFMVVILMIVPAGTLYEAEVAIEQCEKDLPRSQRCKINAIPVGEQ